MITIEGVITLLKKSALLGIFALLVVMMWVGPASAAENGLIYWSNTRSIAHVNPTASNPQPTWVTYEGDGFDISRDGQTLVYQESYFGWGSVGPLYTFPLGGDPYYDMTEVQITNKSSSSGELKYPRFSPDGDTIYFVGKHTLDPPEGVNDPTYDAYAIYSVPTSGGEATKIPINVPNDDGTPTSIYSFALSHGGTKFALGAKGGIFSVPVSGGDATRVTNDSCQRANFPRFSADDQMIVYNAGIWSGSNCTGTERQTIYQTPANNDGTSPGTPLFPEDATDAYPSYELIKYFPSYSPDGKYIAFSYWPVGSNLDHVAIVPAAGGPITHFSAATCSFCYPLWLEKPPETTLTSQPPTVTKDTTASFEFSSNDAAATFECRLDHYWWEEGDGFESCTSPKEYEYDDLLDPDYPPEWQTAEGSHTFEVRAVRSGGAADPTPASYTWAVDTTAPTVGSVSPADAARDVALTANAEATFSEAIDQSTLTSSAFTLTKKDSTTPVAAKVSFDRASNKATLDPASDLEGNTTYTATIKSGSGGVKDEAGNALEQDYSWTFTTIAPPADTTKPTVQSLLATDLSGNVPLRKTSFKATFSEKMKTTTLNTTTFKIFKCSSTTSTTCTTQITNAPVTPSTDGLSATLNPYGTASTLLATKTKYKVVLTTGAQDLAGNALAQEKVSYFTTGSS